MIPKPQGDFCDKFVTERLRMAEKQPVNQCMTTIESLETGFSIG
jgi:hypothetical protein